MWPPRSTLAGVLAMVLAIGRATGREAAVRALVVAAIMLAPALGTASGVLLLSPDHVGTQVPLLLILLVLDRAKPRWYARRHRRAGCVDGAGRPACRARRRHSAGGGGRRSGVPDPARRYDLGLLAAALVSAPVAEGALSLIRHAGGFAVSNPLIMVVPPVTSRSTRG